MDRRTFMDALLEAAEARGLEAEAYADMSEAFEASVSEGGLERYESARGGGLSLRVNLDGRCGYAYTERFEDAEALLLRALDNARAIEAEEAQPMQGRCDYAAAERPALKLMAMSEAEKIELALALERETLAQDARITRCVYCNVCTGSREIWIRNTRGLDAARSSAFAFSYVMPAAEEAGELQTGFGFRLMDEAADIAGCAREAAAEALGRLNARPVASGSYRVVVQNLAMAELLNAFMPMFSAEEAQKGCSLLKGREGEPIGADCVTVIDDPFHPIAPRAFDDEGTPCRRKSLVENGILRTLLHNLKTAKKAGVLSTGNASRAGAASPVSAAPSVWYIEPGGTGFEALLGALGDGLLITELTGLHAGLSAISGDFSLKASGFLVEKGIKTRPVGHITLAGNFLKLLREVERVGDDLRFMEPGRCYT
ncbi:MAG: TldD/PmbA family protein, partial [Clostridia bacterium]|nr:TldD/PmbA family protein [Clostridia bacterium]